MCARARPSGPPLKTRGASLPIGYSPAPARRPRSSVDGSTPLQQRPVAFPPRLQPLHEGPELRLAPEAIEVRIFLEVRVTRQAVRDGLLQPLQGLLLPAHHRVSGRDEVLGVVEMVRALAEADGRRDVLRGVLVVSRAGVEDRTKRNRGVQLPFRQWVWLELRQGFLDPLAGFRLAAKVDEGG